MGTVDLRGILGMNMLVLCVYLLCLFVKRLSSRAPMPAVLDRISRSIRLSGALMVPSI